MKTYVGTKIIKAVPAIRKGGKIYENGDPIPRNMDVVEEGYKVVYPDGYESWSPKDVFEAAYRPVDNLTFGVALEMAKKGAKIVRSGWNGKGMFIVYQKAYPNGIPCNQQTAEAWGLEPGELFRCEPYLQIKMVNGSHSMWIPSINDCLAEDWSIVE